MSKNTGGRPPKYDKDFHPASFIALSDQGKCLTQIARVWKINRDTIYDWEKKHPKFSDAIKKGKECCEAWYMDLGQAAMVGQASVQGTSAEGRPIRIPVKMNTTMFVWMTKNLFKWTDKVEVESSQQVQIEGSLSPEEQKQRLKDKIRKWQSLDE